MKTFLAISFLLIVSLSAAEPTVTIDGKTYVTRKVEGQLYKKPTGQWVLELGTPPTAVTLQKVLGYPKEPVKIWLLIAEKP